MESNVKKTCLSQLNLPQTKQAKKNTRSFYFFMLSYFTIAITAYYLNIAENDTIINFVNSVGTFIPSIKGTAEISKNANYASLVLVLSWCFIIPFSYYLIKNADWNRRSDNFKNIELLIIAFTLFLLGALWALMFTVPSTSGQYARLIFNIISSFTFGISIWGFIIWIAVSASLSSITILIVVKFKAMFGRS